MTSASCAALPTGLRDDQGKIVESGPVETVFTSPSTPIPPSAGYRSRVVTAAADTSRPVVMEGKDLRVWFPIKAGSCAVSSIM